MDNSELFIRALTEQKGQLAAYNCLLIALLSHLPPAQRIETFRKFDTVTETTRAALLNSRLPDTGLAAFDQQIETLRHLRNLPVEDSD